MSSSDSSLKMLIPGLQRYLPSNWQVDIPGLIRDANVDLAIKELNEAIWDASRRAFSGNPLGYRSGIRFIDTCGDTVKAYGHADSKAIFELDPRMDKDLRDNLREKARKVIELMSRYC